MTRSFVRRWAALTCIAQVTLTVSPTAHLAAQNTPLPVDVKLVNVFVSVTDRNGAIVGGLTRDEFSLTEDGRAQQIAIFERQSDMPLNLTLAIDTSDSVAKDLTVEQRAARRFVDAVLRPHDQFSLLEFASAVWELTPFTNNLNKIERGIAGLRGGGGTAFYDAVLLGSKQLGRRHGRRLHTSGNPVQTFIVFS
jgi:Ca-activated chloride channel homolog